jgi:DnaA N-terminal domain
MASQQERRDRVVRGGSRRRRDLAAVGLTDHADAEAAKRTREQLAQQEREVRLRPQVRTSPAADEAWEAVRTALRDAVPESTFNLWLDPLACVGEVSGALAVEAPEGIFAWTFRRYGALLGNAARDTTDHRGVFLFRAQPAPLTDEDGLL